MKLILTAFGALALTSSPALAQDTKAEKPKMCEMMHDGKKMQGMLMKDKDGKMSCQMIDHSKMDHPKKGHGQSGHGKTKAAEPEKPQDEHKHD